MAFIRDLQLINKILKVDINSESEIFELKKFFRDNIKKITNERKELEEYKKSQKIESFIGSHKTIKDFQDNYKKNMMDIYRRLEDFKMNHLNNNDII